LAARAHLSGRGVRRACYRHLRLLAEPLAVVLWKLGAEPFAAAALGWGDQHDRRTMAVAGEPRHPGLAFRLLLRVAGWFTPRFEGHAADRETVPRGKSSFSRARTAPQVLVANAATVKLLGDLGRRLAYLPTVGPNAADEAIVRLGRHLRFLWDR